MLPIIAALPNEQERDAIGAIFEKEYPRMKSLAMSILHNEQDAEDAAMNAVTYMCQHADLFIDYPSRDTISLVFLCVKRASIDLYRKNEYRCKHVVLTDNDSGFFEQIPDNEPSFADMVISQENLALLVRAIDRLEDMYRIPILLRYHHRMRNTEIAEMLHIDANMVNARIFRAKKQLEKILMEMGYTHE